MTETKKRITSKKILNILEHLGYKFRLNVLTDRIEVNGEPITDIHLAVIRTELKDRGIGNARQVEDAVLQEADKHHYHPIKEYFQSLLGWDGQPHIARLASFFDDRDGLFPMLLDRWMIGSVEKIFTGGQAQNPVLVLDGAQNLGKSHFCWWLMAAHLREKYFIESAIDPDDKDNRIRLINKWIWEVSELGATFKRADVEALKAYITLRQVVVRTPYARYDIVKPAMASFIGTINNAGGFLLDPTGHRRFRPCHLTKIDWSYAEKISQADIWSEAYSRYLHGETHVLTLQQQHAMAHLYDYYELEDPIMEMLKNHFQLGTFTDWMSSEDILSHLTTMGILQGGFSIRNSMALSKAAKKLHLTKKKKKNIWGYEGIGRRGP
jgi:predicted P-loop ATPase